MKSLPALLAFLFLPLCALAQPRVTQGAEFSQLLPDVYPPQILTSASGKHFAIGWTKHYRIYDIDAATVSKLETPESGILAPDFVSISGHSCCYASGGGAGMGAKNFWSYYGLVNRDPSFVYKDSLMVLGVGKDGTVYGTATWKKQIYAYGYKPGIGGYIGLWTVDPKTGKFLKQLRSDTLAWNDNDEAFYPRLHLTPTVLVIADFRDKARDKYRILPYGTADEFQLPYLGRLMDLGTAADDRYFYIESSRGSSYATLRAFDLKTGEAALELSASSDTKPDDCKGCVNLFADNAIYRYRSAYRDGSIVRTVEKYSIADAALKREAVWTVPTSGPDGVNLDSKQLYVARILAGPSLLLLPQLERRNDNDPGNEAFLVDLPSGKVTWKIAPFYHVSPEIKAYNAQVAIRNAEAEAKKEAERKAAIAKREADCAAKEAKGGYHRGHTYLFENKHVILQGYDCEKNLYTILIPRSDSYSEMFSKKLLEYERPGLGRSLKQYYTCEECDGDGSYEVTEYTTKTKDLPWGYFSGIETKRISTTSTTRLHYCKKCNGFGVVLK